MQLFGRELEHEIGRKAACVSLDGFVQIFCGNGIEPGKIGIQHYPGAAYKKDFMTNQGGWNNGVLRRRLHRSTGLRFQSGTSKTARRSIYYSLRKINSLINYK